MCTHANRAFVVTGWERVVLGEYDDNITEREMCLDCGAIIEPDNQDSDEPIPF